MWKLRRSTFSVLKCFSENKGYHGPLLPSSGRATQTGSLSTTSSHPLEAPRLSLSQTSLDTDPEIRNIEMEFHSSCGVEQQLSAPGDPAEEASRENFSNNEINSELELELDVPVEEQRSIKVAIIGAPNAGKSTLINLLLGRKVLAVSPKAHTTNRRSLGVVTKGNTQIELVDTPGIIPVSYARSLKMSRQFSADPGRSLMEADLVAVMVDASNKLKREQLDLSVLGLLQKFPLVPSVLILNKVDLVPKKTILLKLAEYMTGSDNTDRQRIGYLVRRWKDERVPISKKLDVKEELKKLRKEAVARKKLVDDRLKAMVQAQLEREEKIAEPKQKMTEPKEKMAEPKEKMAEPKEKMAEPKEKMAEPKEKMAKPKEKMAKPKEKMAEPMEKTAEEKLKEGVEEKKQGEKTKEAIVALKNLPPLTRSCWPYFKEVFMISALEGDGVQKFTDYLQSCAKRRKWDYCVDDVTDQSCLSLVEDIIREKICLHTTDEIPYVTRQENIIWEFEEGGTLNVYQNIHCGKRSRAAILIGSEGRMINTIKEEATRDIEALFGHPVNLTLHVKK